MGHQKVGEGIGVPGGNAVVVVIGVVVPLGQKTDGQDPAEALQIVEIDVLCRSGGIEGDDLPDLRPHAAVQIPAQQLIAQEDIRGRDGQLHPGIRPGQLLREDHPQQGMDIGDAGKDGAGSGIAVQIQQQAALLKSGGGEVQPGQVGKQPVHDLPGLPETFLFKLGVVIGPQPPLLPGSQAQVVDQIIQSHIGQHPLPRQRFGQGRPLDPGQPGQGRHSQALGLQQVPQVLTEQLHIAHLAQAENCQ